MKTLISQIVDTTNHHVLYGQCDSFLSPLPKKKYEVCNLIIEMSKCHHPIRVYNGLQLINDMVKNIEYHVRLSSSKNIVMVFLSNMGK